MATKKVSISLGQIITALLITIATGILGYIGNDIANSLDSIHENEKKIVAVDSSINKELRPNISDIENSVKENKLKMGSMDANIRKLEIMVNRLEVIVNKLDEYEGN